MPDVFEIKDPPRTVNNIKYKLKLLSDFISVKPELLRLLKTLIIVFSPLKLFKYTSKIKTKDIKSK